MSVFIINLILSTFFQSLIIRFKNHPKFWGLDKIQSGPQKIHSHPTPRLGGLGLYLATLCSFLGFWVFSNRPFLDLHLIFLVVTLPALLGGLIEDCTGQVQPKIRLLLTFTSSLLAIFFLNSIIIKSGFSIIDQLLQYSLLSLLLTLLMTSGLTNAFNIIDGFNGLASVVGLLICLSLFYVSFMVNDFFIMMSSLALAGAICGFLVWNYPNGLIFLGDGGAYLIGFWIAQLSILLVNRNDSVSPWFAILINLYPVTETIFSIYRKKLIRNTSPSQPDGLHFHMLIYKRLVRWVTDNQNIQVSRNSMTAPYLWAMTLLTLFPALLFWKYKWPLIITCFLFVSLYVWLYWKIVRFQSPKFLVQRKNKPTDFFPTRRPNDK